MKAYKTLFKHKRFELILEKEKSVIVLPLVVYDKAENMVAVGLIYWHLLLRINPKTEW